MATGTTPPTMPTAGVEQGGHVDDDRTSGGHVLDFELEKGVIELCPGTDLELKLPLTQDFSRANLAPEDLDEKLHTTEVKD